MDLSQLSFVKCPVCQKYSLNKESYLSLFDEDDNESKEIIEWECPYCFSLISAEELEKNIIKEVNEELDKQNTDFRFGKILKHLIGEISAKDITAKMKLERLSALRLALLH